MLVATDIAARGIDVVALGHVVNFDVPAASEDYIHRVGRTGRAELTGEAFTFVAPEDEQDLRAIERALGKPLPRVLLPDFDYRQKPPEAAPARHEAHPRHAPQGRPRRPGGPTRGRSEPQGAWAGRVQAEAPRPAGHVRERAARPAASGRADARPPRTRWGRARVLESRRDARAPSARRIVSRGAGPSRGRPRATTPSPPAAAATTTPTTPPSRTRRSGGSRSSPPFRCGPAASCTTPSSRSCGRTTPCPPPRSRRRSSGR